MLDYENCQFLLERLKATYSLLKIEAAQERLALGHPTLEKLTQLSWLEGAIDTTEAIMQLPRTLNVIDFDDPSGVQIIDPIDVTPPKDLHRPQLPDQGGEEDTDP